MGPRKPSTRKASTSGDATYRANGLGGQYHRDGRLLVAAYGDGTIRWHRMDDGRELLALYVLADKQNWVAWTPEGFYAATPGAFGVLRWQVNRRLRCSGRRGACLGDPETCGGLMRSRWCFKNWRPRERWVSPT